MIVCIEGVDGCGKSTQAALLTKYIGAKFYKFPNRDSPTGKLIYEHLEHRWNAKFATEEKKGTVEDHNLNALLFQSLQVTNRMELAVELSKLKSKNVVLDRYWPSGFAYGKADGLDGQYLIDLHDYLPQPDLFILLDVDLQDSSQRRPERRDRYEQNTFFMEKVIANYRILWHQMAQSQPWRWVMIDARKSKEETTSAINQAIADWRTRNSET